MFFMTQAISPNCAQDVSTEVKELKKNTNSLDSTSILCNTETDIEESTTKRIKICIQDMK